MVYGGFIGNAQTDNCKLPTADWKETNKRGTIIKATTGDPIPTLESGVLLQPVIPAQAGSGGQVLGKTMVDLYIGILE